MSNDKIHTTIIDDGKNDFILHDVKSGGKIIIEEAYYKNLGYTIDRLKTLTGLALFFANEVKYQLDTMEMLTQETKNDVSI